MYAFVEYLRSAFTYIIFNIAFNNVFYRAFRQFIKIEAPHLDTQFIDLIYIIKYNTKYMFMCIKCDYQCAAAPCSI